jgi:hypothetical protein
LRNFLPKKQSDGKRLLAAIQSFVEDRRMRGDGEETVGWIELLARWTFWPVSILTAVCLAMLYMGASDRTWQWVLQIYALVGIPIVMQSFMNDFAGLRGLWRLRRGSGNNRR